MDLPSEYSGNLEARTALIGILRSMVGDDTNGLMEQTSDCSWTEIEALAADQGVLPFLSLIKDSVPIPGSVREAIVAEQIKVAKRNLLLSSELMTLCDKFASKEIEVVAFKGPLFALQIYSNLSIRPSGDIDLLTRPNHVSDITANLVANGYVQIASWPDSLQQTFEHPHSGVTVDLHWGMPPAFAKIDSSELMNSKIDLSVLGGKIPTFTFIDTIIISCTNLMKEYWKASLRHVLDVRLGLASMDASQWQALRLRSRVIGAERFVLAAASVCALLFPEGMNKQIIVDANKSPLIRRLAFECVECFRVGSGAASPIESGRWYRAILQQNLSIRLQMLISLTFRTSDSDREFLALPRYFSPLYLLVRPVRLAKIFLGSTFKFFSSDRKSDY